MTTNKEQRELCRDFASPKCTTNCNACDSKDRVTKEQRREKMREILEKVAFRNLQESGYMAINEALTALEALMPKHYYYEGTDNCFDCAGKCKKSGYDDALAFYGIKKEDKPLFHCGGYPVEERL